MKHRPIPYCYYPTTVLFIGKEALLNKTQTTLHTKKFVPRYYYDDPMEAFDLLSTHQSLTLSRCADFPIDHFDIAKIHTILLQPERFSEISTVVIDNALLGRTLCESIKTIAPGIKIVLLIHRGDDQQTVIDLFNEGLISCYVAKENPIFFKELTLTIEMMQLDYFKTFSDLLLHRFIWSTPKLLADPSFIDFLRTVYQRHELAEYYLLDWEGSFLFVDAAGHLSHLCVTEGQTIRENITQHLYLNDKTYSYVDGKPSGYLKDKAKILSFNAYAQRLLNR